MFNACLQCGAYRADKAIDPDSAVAICPECGHPHPFLRLPLLIVSGASGAGKSTIGYALLGHLPQVVILDCDILWQPEFNTPQNNHRAFFETWLRVCKNIAQSGRPVLLFGAGMGVPENIEPCVERRYFSSVAYLALVCEPTILAQRLQRRPVWRGSHAAAFITEQQHFNHWFKSAKTTPPITLLDTTDTSVESTAIAVSAWVHTTLHTA